MINKYLITSSIGIGKERLTSFDAALLKSKIGNYNLVRVSSILPAKSTQSKHVGIPEGSVLFTAYSHISSSTFGDKLTAAVAVGFPKDKNQVGVIMEIALAEDKENVEHKIANMVKEALEARGSELAELVIETSSIEVDDSDRYFTAFSAVAMWEASYEKNV